MGPQGPVGPQGPTGTATLPILGTMSTPDTTAIQVNSSNIGIKTIIFYFSFLSIKQ